ncbi:hypothetical protein KGF57_000290 [Candida theae]|uniref:Transcription initiation factor TFIID subunit 8 n=1 Tax=Candida theae TaxID=1198502 RepID=A0AAD5G0U9_9ASCO|nr:uncharacterized protein KGF57_000290 [Candida theae]KAI5967773.1 hypothetical protein KGF57_000290 [Candida theae]
MTSSIKPWEQSPADAQLVKVIAVILKSRGYHFTEDFMSQMFDLATGYINHLLSDLLEYTQLQRRRKPSLSDIRLILEENDLSPNALVQQIQISRGLSDLHRQQIQKVTSIEVPSDDEFSLNEQYAISEVVPNIRTKPKYIPSYMPDLPPDYTYQSTPTFSQPLTDLKQLRRKLVEESRLTEKSLYKLIESDASDLKLKAEFEKELTELAEKENTTDVPVEEVPKVKEEIAEGPSNAVEESTGTSIEEPVNKFDFIKYAQKRKELRFRKQARLEEQQKKRDTDIFMKAERYYSPYATEKPTAQTEKYFNNILNDEFKKVIVSIRSEEEKKRKELEAQKELKERQEREFREQNEIQFHFQQNNPDSSDLDSDEMEDF